MKGIIALVLVICLAACAAPVAAEPFSAPERIISGFYISTSAMIALGIDDRLVGIEARADTRPIYAIAAPHLLDLPNVGTAREFNLEAALALEPDLAVLPVRLRDAGEIMEELGITVVFVEPEDPERLLLMIEEIGRAAGASERAQELTDAIEASLAEIREMTAGLTNRPRVYMGGVGTYLSTAPGGMFQSELIEMAGGVNVAGDTPGSSRIDVSYEQLLAWNPDVIIIPPEAGYCVEDILANPQLAQLDAVQNGHVYRMPGGFEAWDSPVPSFTMGVRWLLAGLHPEIYSQAEFWDYVHDFYWEFYGVMVTTAFVEQ